MPGCAECDLASQLEFMIATANAPSSVRVAPSMRQRTKPHRFGPLRGGVSREGG
jgi:hypothetical protein